MSLLIFLRMMFLLTISFYAFPPSLKAGGPWKAQVVDAETKQPLQGVVVLAVWSQYALSGEGYPLWVGYVDSEEVVTDKEGQFTIAARSFSTFNGLVFDEPQFYLFKPGYGQWRFQGEEVWLKLDAPERHLHFQELARQFVDKGVVIELPPLKTREERLQFYQSFGRIPSVPLDKMKRWKDAADVERAYLGL